MSEIGFFAYAVASDTVTHPTMKLIADICGWFYVFIWGSYQYPQVFLNYKLKNVEGFKLDYPFLNLSGYIFISISNSVAFFWNGLPFQNYGMGKVEIQDVLYGWNGLFVCLILNYQALIYKRGKNTISMFSFWFTIFAWSSSIVVYILTEVTGTIEISQVFNIIQYLGDLKIGVNMIKYVPLIYFNFIRKTTGGMSITAFLLNMIGAIFSLSQMILAYLSGATPTFNRIKTGLAIVTIFYDLILMFQYYLYRERPALEMDNSSIVSGVVYSSVNEKETHAKLIDNENHAKLIGNENA